MAGQQFFDVEAMATLGTKGPSNVTRIAADQNGNLRECVKGTFYSVVGSSLARAALANADATVAVGTASEFTLPDTTLTANHSITLSPTGAGTGEVIRIVRIDKTAFTLAIINGGPGAGTLLTMPISARRIADFVFDGTNWALSGFVRLAL